MALFAAPHESGCGTNRTNPAGRLMSVSGGRADMPCRRAKVSVCPISDIARCRTTTWRCWRGAGLGILPRMLRSPVEICFGTSPSQTAKSRPLEKQSPAGGIKITDLRSIQRQGRVPCPQRGLQSRTRRSSQRRPQRYPQNHPPRAAQHRRGASGSSSRASPSPSIPSRAALPWASSSMILPP
jgi:hypothetical protein